MNANHTIIDLPTVPVPLAADAHCIFPALGNARLVHATDGLGVGMLFRDDLLAAVSKCLFIPLDRFEKTLQRPRYGLELQGNSFGRFAV